jgi:hypothetical protein
VLHSRFRASFAPAVLRQHPVDDDDLRRVVVARRTAWLRTGALGTKLLPHPGDVANVKK